jgi:hypothetical protein
MQMIKRAKCVSVHAYRGALRDPELVKGQFYTVLDEFVYTMMDETPYIRVKVGTRAIERPRHLFGPVLFS